MYISLLYLVHSYLHLVPGPCTVYQFSVLGSSQSVACIWSMSMCSPIPVPGLSVSYTCSESICILYLVQVYQLPIRGSGLSVDCTCIVQAYLSLIWLYLVHVYLYPLPDPCLSVAWHVWPPPAPVWPRPPPEQPAAQPSQPPAASEPKQNCRVTANLMF